MPRGPLEIQRTQTDWRTIMVEIREASFLSDQKIADLVGASQAQVNRLRRIEDAAEPSYSLGNAIMQLHWICTARDRRRARDKRTAAKGLARERTGERATGAVN